MSPRIHIRDATIADAKLLTDLAYTTFWDAFAHHPDDVVFSEKEILGRGELDPEVHPPGESAVERIGDQANAGTTLDDGRDFTAGSTAVVDHQDFRRLQRLKAD